MNYFEIVTHKICLHNWELALVMIMFHPRIAIVSIVYNQILNNYLSVKYSHTRIYFERQVTYFGNAVKAEVNLIIIMFVKNVILFYLEITK